MQYIGIFSEDTGKILAIYPKTPQKSRPWPKLFSIYHTPADKCLMYKGFATTPVAAKGREGHEEPQDQKPPAAMAARPRLPPNYLK